MYIHRIQLEKINKSVLPGKVIVLYGPRRVGKTTLIKKFLENKSDYLLVSGEDRFTQQDLSSQSIKQLKDFIGLHKLLVVDEAHKIPNIGLNLKLCIDHIENLNIIVTGSSVLDLNKKVGEPLTGRQHILNLFPLAQIELNSIEDTTTRKASLEARLLFGSYPEVVLAVDNSNKRQYLQDLINSYLCKDILEIEGIKKSKKIIDLLQLIALQVGKEVSHTELGSQLGLSKVTVEKYLDLLEKSFIIINIRGFSRNLRKEISKTSKYYFYDTGVRNAIVNNFNKLTARDDVGDLFENYLIIERLKKQHYQQIYTNNYFWRTYDQQEIDWVEDKDGQLCGYEFKWKEKKIKTPIAWRLAYPKALFTVINQDNYMDFII